MDVPTLLNDIKDLKLKHQDLLNAINAVPKAKTAAASAVTAQESAQAILDTANTNLKNAQQAVVDAQAAQEKATEDLATANTNVTTTAQAVSDAETALQIAQEAMEAPILKVEDDATQLDTTPTTTANADAALLINTTDGENHSDQNSPDSQS